MRLGVGTCVGVYDMRRVRPALGVRVRGQLSVCIAQLGGCVSLRRAACIGLDVAAFFAARIAHEHAARQRAHGEQYLQGGTNDAAGS